MDVATGRVVVTPEVLLDRIAGAIPDKPVESKPVWVNNGRAIALAVAADETTQASEASDVAYSVLTVDAVSGSVATVGLGAGPVAATRGGVLAYFTGGSKQRQVALARTDGSALCSVADRDLAAEASGIQAIALTPDGKTLALAIGVSSSAASPSEGQPNAASGDTPRVQVFTTSEVPHTDATVAVWTVDGRCRNARHVATVPQIRIGRLAWADRNHSLLAIAATTVVRGAGMPRSDLIAFDISARRWRTLVANIGDQAGSDSEVFVAPAGNAVAFAYDPDGLPYRVRKQLAIASRADGKIAVTSNDPRDVAGWLDANTLLITRTASHPLLAHSATLRLDGVEREIPAPRGLLTPSPDGTKVAVLETDLYGDTTLYVAPIRRTAKGWAVGTERKIWSKATWLSRYVRGRRELIECASSDGVRPAAIVTLPLNYDSRRKYPLIVDIHGGPAGGLSSGRRPYHGGAILTSSTLEHDLWAAKGYAVLSPDYRASGMYGYDKSSREGDGFAQDFDDIMCNVDAVIERGIADPSRMVVIGHSYGAMEVNWIVTHTNRFAAAISKEGVWNIHMGAAWAAEGRPNINLSLRFGTPIEAPERYRRMSVMESVRGVTTPTMFVEHHAGKRPGISYAWMFAAWQAQGIKSQRRVYDQPSHGLARPADQKDMLETAIAWIDEHLSGRVRQFAAGQVWTFNLDPKEPDATLTILRVEALPDIGEVVHVAVSAVRTAAGTSTVDLLSFSRDAIDRSVLKLLRTEPVPPRLPKNYNSWKNAGGHVLKVTVNEALMSVRASLEASHNTSCAFDRERMFTLNQDAFDQDMTGGWRKLAMNEKCLGAAADLIRDYRETNRNKAPILFWHEGQLRAQMGATEEAIRLFEMSRKPAESSMGWNEYVEATLAFLRKDRVAFEKARAALASLPRPAGFDLRDPNGDLVSWPMNLKVVDGLGRCFGLPYKQAYGRCE